MLTPIPTYHHNYHTWPLYVPRCLLPGCSTITWSTLNIDAYLHQATSAVASFQTTVSRIRSILDDHVYSVLRDIAKSSLYDVELATSRKWVRT